MVQRLKAIYEDGFFKPQEPFVFPQGAIVNLSVENPLLKTTTVTDPKQRQKVLQEIFASMDANPVLENAPRKLTRDELHERH